MSIREKADPSLASSVGRNAKNASLALFCPSAYASGPHFHLIGSSPVHKITKPQINKKQALKRTWKKSMVECTGFEPVTSWLPAMRSTS